MDDYTDLANKINTAKTKNQNSIVLQTYYQPWSEIITKLDKTRKRKAVAEPKEVENDDNDDSDSDSEDDKNQNVAKLLKIATSKK
jgi:hypothetical protein